jgi:hypothetical protein
VLNLGEIVPFLKLNVLLFVELIIKNTLFLLELKLGGQLALVRLGQSDFLEFFPEISALSDEVNDDSMYPCASAFLVESHLILVLVIGDAEYMAFLMLPIYLGDPQFFD